MSNAARYLTMVSVEGARKPILAAYDRTNTPKDKYALYVSGLRMLPGGPPVQHMLDAAVSSYGLLQGAGLTDLNVVGHAKAPELALKIATVRPVVLQSGIAVAKVLGAIGGAKPVAALLSLFDDPKLHANVRKVVAEQLRFLRDGESMSALVLSLKSKSAAVRSMAAEILAAVPEPAINAAILKRAKREKDPSTLAALLQALGDHGDPSAISLLLKHAKRRPSKDDNKDMARRAAIRSLARIGFDNAKVRKFMLGLLESRSDVNRMLALNAAGASGDAGLVPRVAKSLGHGTWQVRLTAINALGRIRAKECIPLLIAALEREEEDRLRDALAQALFRLTGQNLYDNAKIWKSWWSENEATFVIPAREPEMPEEHAGPSRAGFYGIPIRTRRVTFVIDQSGSMSAAGDVGSSSDNDDDLNRLDVAVREVLRAMDRLEDSTQVNVIFFHSTIHPWQDGLRKLTRSNRSALRSHLEKQKPNGGTNLYDGLEQGLLMKDVDTVFLLSDGVPGAGKYIATPDIVRAIRRLNQTRQVAIHCVSIGVDSDLLRQLAKEHGGRYVRK